MLFRSFRLCPRTYAAPYPEHGLRAAPLRPASCSCALPAVLGLRQYVLQPAISLRGFGRKIFATSFLEPKRTYDVTLFRPFLDGALNLSVDGAKRRHASDVYACVLLRVGRVRFRFASLFTRLRFHERALFRISFSFII